MHSVENIPQKGEGDFLLASEINTILKTISGIFFDDSNGNVGVGTSSPDAKLEIEMPGNGTWGNSYVRLGEMAEKDQTGMLVHNSSDYVFLGLESRDETKNNNYNTILRFGDDDGDDFQIQESDNRVLMTIKNGGNVGIGTTSPRAKVEIKNTADTDNDLLIYSTSTEYGEPEWARIGLMREGDPDEGFLGFYGNAAAEYPSGIMLGVRGANPIRFNNNELERMRISPDGNVGIGTVKPLKKLDVAGDLRFNYNALIAGFDSSIDSNYDHIWVNDGDQVYGGNAIGNWVFAHDSGYKAAGNSALVAGNVWMRGSTFDNYFAGNVGIGTTSPSEKLHVSGNIKGSSFMYSSDRTKKQNIKSLKNALEVVQNLRGVEFEWKENGQKSIGFLAQEVEEILPELVHGAEGEKSVEYGNLTAILVEAVKTQQAQIEAQNARIAALELEVSK